MIDTNDYATLTRIGNSSYYRGYKMIGDTNTLYIYFANTPFTTEIDSCWVGVYYKRSANAFSNTITNTNADLHNTDSGIAFAWQNRTLQPGESTQHSFIIGIGDSPKKNNPPEISISKLQDTILEKTNATINITVKDPDAGSKITGVYMKIGDEKYILKKDLPASETTFEYEIDAQKLNLGIGVHSIEFFCVDDNNDYSHNPKLLLTIERDYNLNSNPVISFTIPKTEYFREEIMELTLGQVDAEGDDVKVSYRIDNENPVYIKDSLASGSSFKFNYTILNDSYYGTHTVQAIFEENIESNQKIVSKTLQFVVKRDYSKNKAPTLIINAIEPKYYTTDILNISGIVEDPDGDASDIEISIGGLPDGTLKNIPSGKTFSKSFPLSNYKEGQSYDIQIKAKDCVEINKRESAKFISKLNISRNYEINTAPKIITTDDNYNYYIGDTTDIQVTVIDDQKDNIYCSYSINDGDFIPIIINGSSGTIASINVSIQNEESSNPRFDYGKHKITINTYDILPEPYQQNQKNSSKVISFYVINSEATDNPPIINEFKITSQSDYTQKDNEYVHNERIEFSFKGEDSDSGDQLELTVLLDGSLYTEKTSNNNMMTEVIGYDIPSSLEIGTHVVKAILKDQFGKFVSVNKIFTIVRDYRDNNPPVISNERITDNILYDDSPISLTALLTDSDGDKLKVSMWIDDNEKHEKSGQDQGIFSYQIPVPSGQHLSIGKHKLRINVTDEVKENSKSDFKEIEFTVYRKYHENNSPTLNLNDIESEYKNNEIIQISGTVNDIDNDNVSVYMNFNNEGFELIQEKLTPGSSFENSINLIEKGLDYGTYNITFFAIDHVYSEINHMAYDKKSDEITMSFSVVRD